ncbi:polysaccharide deacetylase family protein, partial [Rhizobium ruizarguesonis]
MRIGPVVEGQVDATIFAPGLIERHFAEQRVSATFFVLGAYVKDHPNIVRRIAAEGHLVANHTMTHPDITACDPEAIEREIN